MKAERWQVPPEAAGERLDRALARHLEVPRNQVRSWIKARRVLLNGGRAKPSALLTAGDLVQADPPPPKPVEILPEAGELAWIHREEGFAVLDKPAGLAVHPGAGREAGTLAHRLLHHFPETAAVGGPGRPGIVHRLDKDTTGALVVARSDTAYRHLASAFAERRVDKAYLAVVHGTPRARSGSIDLPIGRHPQERKKMAVRPVGRPAHTRYRVAAEAAGLSLLALEITTGRTHQIRVHLKALGHPIVGDPIYGEARWRGLVPPARTAAQRFPRPALHAWRLAFDHPETGERLRFEAPIPEDLDNLWRKVSGRAVKAESGLEETWAER